jgi:hypothetical protein
VCVCVCVCARALKMQTIIVKPIGMYTNDLVLRPEYATGNSVSLRHTFVFLPFHSEYFSIARRMCSSLTKKFICKLSIQIVPFNDSFFTRFESKHYLKTENFVDVLALNSKYTYVILPCISITQYRNPNRRRLFCKCPPYEKFVVTEAL